MQSGCTKDLLIGPSRGPAGRVECGGFGSSLGIIYPYSDPQSPHAGVAQPTRKTHQLMGFGIGRP
eukprot:COSAG01_NODE_27381_length_687_cov_1.042517_1_plen_64_part_10